MLSDAGNAAGGASESLSVPFREAGLGGRTQSTLRAVARIRGVPARYVVQLAAPRVVKLRERDLAALEALVRAVFAVRGSARACAQSRPSNKSL